MSHTRKCKTERLKKKAKAYKNTETRLSHPNNCACWLCDQTGRRIDRGSEEREVPGAYGAVGG